MLIDFEKITPHERYKLLTAAVVPRPIALVSTLARDGTVNAAPFSFFNVFSEDPALAVLGLQHAPDGSVKDTTRHILDNGEFVINLVDRHLAEAMAVCAARLPADVSEITAAGLSTAASQAISTPRIAEAPVSLECRTWEIRQITPTRHLAVGEIVAMSVRDGLVDPETHYFNMSAYEPVGRLVANSYCHTGDRFELTVPTWPKDFSGPATDRQQTSNHASPTGKP
ncbi:flavin reductase [Anderseniella sp. Alg231-50]|uniref:flavin reductase n=1 Tax=Anderseniella sp. Alg231-50 TaxID=1922226 RepID=UPI000D554D3D